MDLNEKAPRGSTAKILLLGAFDPTGDRIIRDPYYVMRLIRDSNRTVSKVHSNYDFRMTILPVLISVMSSVSDRAKHSWNKSLKAKSKTTNKFIL